MTANMISPYRFAGAGGGGGASDYTVIEGVNGGTITNSESAGVRTFGMSNDGAGKVLWQPTSSAIDVNEGVYTDGDDVGLALKISDHTGWDGTAAWLGIGLGFTNESGLYSSQLQSRNSSTGEFGIPLTLSSNGFVTTSSVGWTSGSSAWGADAITPKTVPIYVGLLYDHATEQLRIYRGTAPSTWSLINAQSVSSATINGWKYGIILFCLTGTQAFEVELEQIYWDWTGTGSWPFT